MSELDPTVVLVVVACTLIFRAVLSQRREVARELARFKGAEVDFFSEVSSQLNNAAATLAERGQGKARGRSAWEKAQQARRRRLEEAGLETPEAQGKYMLFRIICAIAGPAAGLVSFNYVIPYYATLLTLTLSAAGLALPVLWLRSMTASRVEDIQRELPLVLDLTNLGTSAGWDCSAALERVIDALYADFPQHPLIKELKRARLATASGYTWEEALGRAGARLGDDTVKRTTLALVQAIKQGGDRSAQLEGIAQDAQRMYHAVVDKRLAGLPVKAVLITMLLVLSYFLILLSPAVVQLRNAVQSQVQHEKR